MLNKVKVLATVHPETVGLQNQTSLAEPSHFLQRFRRIALALSALLIAIWALVSAMPFLSTRPTASLDAAGFKRHLDARVPGLLQKFAVPGIAFATIVAGKPAQQFAYGLADQAQNRPMTPDTVFEVASISKSFTAWRVMQMVDTFKLDLDSPVEKYVAPWPLPHSTFLHEKVTARHLLDHTAGVNPGNLGVRSTDEPALSTRAVLRGEGRHPMIQTAGPTRLEFAVGERFLYSNAGYMLLQLALEQQTGQRFADDMKARVLEPLGMTSSSFDWDQTLRARTAVPYLADGSASPVTILQDQATGSLFSTAPDLAKFLSASMDKSTAGDLSPASKAALHAPTVVLPTIEVQGLASDASAFGHYVETLADDRYAVMNGGFVPGWTSQFYMVPETGDGIVLLTNSDRGRAVIAEIAADWAAWRGLSTLKMTRTYSSVGVWGPVIIGLLGLLAISIGLSVFIGFGRKHRRLGPNTPGQIARCFGLLVPAIILAGLWFGFARSIAIIGFPWLETPMTAAVVALGVALIASAATPRSTSIVS